MKALIALIAFVISLSGCGTVRYVGNGYGYMQGPPAGFVPPPLRVTTVRPPYAGEIGIIDIRYGDQLEVEYNCPGNYRGWVEIDGMLVTDWNGPKIVDAAVRLLGGLIVKLSVIPGGRQYTSVPFLARGTGVKHVWKMHYGKLVQGGLLVDERGAKTGIYVEGARLNEPLAMSEECQY